jgi:Tfp pilus assembly protein FimT
MAPRDGGVTVVEWLLLMAIVALVCVAASALSR